MERIHCPFHPESTESCVLYPESYHCFGCGAHGPLSDLGGKVAERAPKEHYKEDLQETRKYIDGLPTKTIRGFNLPYDNLGYYLRFPGTLYYKRRNWEDGGAKYKNPSGHSQPPFWVRREGFPALCLSEGEFNGLSVAEAFPEWDVCSPGSASDFKKEANKRFLLTLTAYYCIIIVMVDRDGPGVEAAIYTKGLLVGKKPEIRIVLCESDANELLCESGKEALREYVEAEMSKGL